MTKGILPLSIFLLSVLIGNCNANAQDAAQENEYKEVPLQYYDLSRTGFIPDTLTRFRGGIKGVRTYIQKNIRYPASSAIGGEKGGVIVGFAVNIDGTTGEIKILKSATKSLDREAMRIIKLLKDWQPAIKDGKPVKVYYKQIISFDTFIIRDYHSS